MSNQYVHSFSLYQHCLFVIILIKTIDLVINGSYKPSYKPVDLPVRSSHDWSSGPR